MREFYQEIKSLITRIFLQQHEIETLNNEEFKSNANWLQMLTSLMEDVQDHETAESEEALRKWSAERDEIR